MGIFGESKKELRGRIKDLEGTSRKTVRELIELQARHAKVIRQRLEERVNAEALKEELSQLKKDVEWLDTPGSYKLPEGKITDTELKAAFRDQFGLTHVQSSDMIDWLENFIVDHIAQGKASVVWQGLGTFYAIFSRGKWRPRLKFHKNPRNRVTGDEN